jgi:IS1 family transposase
MVEKKYGRHEETRTPDLYRVKNEVSNLKPFGCRCFPHTNTLQNTYFLPSFVDELLTSFPFALFLEKRLFSTKTIIPIFGSVLIWILGLTAILLWASWLKPFISNRINITPASFVGLVPSPVFGKHVFIDQPAIEDDKQIGPINKAGHFTLFNDGHRINANGINIERFFINQECFWWFKNWGVVDWWGFKFENISNKLMRGISSNNASWSSSLDSGDKNKYLRIALRLFDRYCYPWSFGIYNSLGIQESGVSRLLGSHGLDNQKNKANNPATNANNGCQEIPVIQAIREGIVCLIFIVGCWFLFWFFPNRECANGWFCFGVIAVAACWYFGLLFLCVRWFGGPDLGPMDKWKHCKQGHTSDNYPRFHIDNVLQKNLTCNNLCITVIYMANALNTDKKIAVIGALAEGSSIRSIERITGVHRDTIMRLGVKVGKGCAALLDAKMRNLPCKYLEFDEIWGFVGKKEKHVTVDDSPEMGDVWTFCAVDAETKIVPTFRCGKRDRATTNAFVQDVASRMTNRVQISTDGLKAYVEAVEKSFGSEVDYAQIVKTYTHNVEMQPNRRYSAPEIVSTEKKIFTGSPDVSRISTSYIERLNGTTRTSHEAANALDAGIQ